MDYRICGSKYTKIHQIEEAKFPQRYRWQSQRVESIDMEDAALALVCSSSHPASACETRSRPCSSPTSTASATDDINESLPDCDEDLHITVSAIFLIIVQGVNSDAPRRLHQQ